MQKIRRRCRRYLREIAGNACATALSSIRDISDRGAMTVARHRETRSNGRRADSESWFLAIKKFSRPTPSRLIALAKRGFLRESIAADSGRLHATDATHRE
jgi:hypothetical protein